MPAARNIAGKATAIQAALRAEHLGQALPAVLTVLNTQIAAMQKQVGQHPAAEIITSHPGLGQVLGAQVLAEFGDAPPLRHCQCPQELRWHLPGHPRVREEKVALARFVHNDRLIDALMTQVFSALRHSPGARAYYDKQRARGCEYNAARRRPANRLIGILHGCLKTSTSTTRPPPGLITPSRLWLDI